MTSGCGFVVVERCQRGPRPAFGRRARRAVVLRCSRSAIARARRGPEAREVEWPDGLLLVGPEHTLDEHVAVGVAIGGATQCDAEVVGDLAVVVRGELGSVVVAKRDVDRLVGVGPVREGGRPGHRHRRRDVGRPAPVGEGPAQDGAVEAVDDRGQVGPAVLATPHARHVGLPQLVRTGDAERPALGLRVALWLGAGEPPGADSRATRLRLTT